MGGQLYDENTDVAITKLIPFRCPCKKNWIVDRTSEMEVGGEKKYSREKSSSDDSYLPNETFQ